MQLRTAAAIARYNISAQLSQASQTHKADDLERRCQELCADDDASKEEEWGGGRQKSESRASEARRLAERYTMFMGFDIDEAQGRAMFERTATFYSQNDSLLGCLRELVTQHCPT